VDCRRGILLIRSASPRGGREVDEMGTEQELEALADRAARGEEQPS
jgi:hypothetical protein